MTTPLRRALLICVLVVAGAIRVAWCVLAAPVPESDFLTFFSTAQLIAQGNWWPSAYGWAWQGAGYPLLIAPLTFLGDWSLTAIHAVNVALGVMTVALVYRLGRTLFGPRAGLVAAAVAAALPGLWLWTPLVTAENLSVPMLVGIAVLVVEHGRPWRLILAGTLAGALVFVRPSTLLFVAVGFVIVIVLARSGTRRYNTLAFAAGAAIAVGFFATLNLRAGGPALPVGASGWQPWLVYNERATGSWYAAQARDDYPFHGVEGDARYADIIRSAQLRLAVQFALLNPGEIVPGILKRHTTNWASDRAGIEWTLGRSPRAGIQAAVGPTVERSADAFYLALTGLALVGAASFASRPGVTFALLLPLAYFVAPAVLAEGNPRYHVNGLAYLITLAGAALAARPKVSATVIAAAAALASFATGLVVAPWLVVSALLLGLGRVIADATTRIPDLTHSRIARYSAVAAVIAIELGGAGALLFARDAVVSWSRTQPLAWTLSDSGAEVGSVANAASPIVRPSDVSPRFRKVSFPDAMVLPPPAPGSGARSTSLTTSFPDLDVGVNYVVYLQVFGGASSPGSHVTVRLNDRVVWRSVDAPVTDSGWQDVIVPWTADTPFASIRVERSAAVAAADGEVLVRSVHVYPKY
jgi:hypothetical protein